MTKSSAPRFVYSWLWSILLCLLGLTFSACGQIPTSTTSAVVVPTTAASVPLRTRLEEQYSPPCGALWQEGEESTWRGLYRTSGGEPYLDVLRVHLDAPPCWARFFLDYDLGLGEVSWDRPGYVEVTGRPFSSRWSTAGLWDLEGTRGTVLPFDADAAIVACQQAVMMHSPALQEMDWASLATPAYVTGTAGFHPTVEELQGLLVLFLGADDRQPWVVLEARGPDLPEVRPLVRRWISFDCVYDLDREQMTDLVATIRGEVQE